MQVRVLVLSHRDGDYGLFGLGTSPAMVVKVALNSSVSTAPVRIGALTFLTGENTINVNAGVIDPTTGMSYWSGGFNKIIKVFNGVGDALPTRVGEVAIPSSITAGTIAVAAGACVHHMPFHVF